MVVFSLGVMYDQPSPCSKWPSRYCPGGSYDEPFEPHAAGAGAGGPGGGGPGCNVG